MKRILTKQSALKGLLLLALAGNVSFQPAMKSLNLSSETAGGGTSAPPPQKIEAPVSVSKPPATAVTTSSVGIRPDGAARASDTVAAPPSAPPPAPPEDPLPAEKPARSETPKICNQRFYVTYKEIAFKDASNQTKMMTELRVEPHTGVVSDFKSITYRKNGGFDVNLDQPDVKKDLDAELAAAIKKKLGRCPGDSPGPDSGDDRVSRNDDDKDRIRRGMKDCRLDRHGDPLPETEVVHCRLASLDNVDVDRDDASGQRQAINQIKRIVEGDIRKSIKNRLMSNDNEKVEEGKELLSDTLDRIKDLWVDLRLDPGSYASLRGELESLREGGETYRLSTSLAKDVSGARDDAREQLRLAQADLAANPSDPFARQRLQQVMQEIQYKQTQLSNLVQMSIAPSYARLQADERLGYLSPGELSQFTMPYQGIRTDLMSMLDTRMLNVNAQIGMTQYSLPGDFQSYRQSLAGNFQNNYGVGMPQQPNSLMNNQFGTGMMPVPNNMSTFQSFAAPNINNFNSGRRF